jgi:hypothetical protein
MRQDIPKSSIACTRFENVEEAARPVESQHPTTRTDHVREIERRIARPTANIKNGVAWRKSCAAPDVQHLVTPDPMLQRESRDLFVVRAKHVVTFD